MAQALQKRHKENSIWQIAPLADDVENLAQQLGQPKLLAQLLFNRGICDSRAAQSFLRPSLMDLIDPSNLLNIDKAISRIRKAIVNQEKIMIYGDYDVDGIMSTAILWQCLKLAGREVEFYVPHRLDEGYGLNIEALEAFAEKGITLVITVDCGITAHQAAARASELGIDLIITDHHKLDGSPAAAVAVVHPDLPGQNYANPYLCGAGVAFKLAWALAQSLSESKKVSENFRQFLLSATSMAALGTIADVVPLLGENRVLAIYGMQGLAQSNDPGILALIKAAGLTGEKLSSMDIGFKLAPKLNAAGRMGHARLAIEMFTKSDLQKASEIATYLESQNRQRQKVEKEITEQAKKQIIDLEMDTDKYSCVVVADENWHGGVIGIVASRIIDKYHKPTIVISLDNGKPMGSCRSVPGFDIHSGLNACSQYLNGFGGHAMAAGLKIDADKIDDFREAFNAYVKANISQDGLVSKLAIDAEISLDMLTLAAVEQIEKLGPFGQSNPAVRLLARNLKLIEPPRPMGQKGTHLTMIVTDKDDNARFERNGMFRVVAFSKAAKWEKLLQNAQSIDLVFEPMINRFNGNSTVELMAIDLKVNQ